MIKDVKLPDAEVESLAVDEIEVVGLGETLADAERELVRVDIGETLNEGVTEPVVVLDNVGRNVVEIVDVAELELVPVIVLEILEVAVNVNLLAVLDTLGDAVVEGL